MDILAFDLKSSLDYALNILQAALGLGLVIFFHEFGHFALAKWCGVSVERFSIGFGPILWSFKKGETEYALSLVPFGGYVKMLGQDDLDPSQLTSEEIARDPKAYSNKTVGQRMAIISAGVIMNIITGMMFFAIAFKMGVDSLPSMVGNLQIGKPAWEKGLRPGDKITRINNEDTVIFDDIVEGVVVSRGVLELEGTRLSGETFKISITPDQGSRRTLGISPNELQELTIAEFSPEMPLIALPESAAAEAKPSFLKGDKVVQVGDQPVQSYFELQQLMAERRGETLDFVVQRGNEKVTIPVAPKKFKDLGMVFDIEKIAAIQQGSPAATAKLLVDDKITKVNGEDVGTRIDPLFLSDYFEKLAGQEVEVQVKRLVAGNPEPQQVTVKLTPKKVPAWIEQPLMPGTPLSIPSIGVAYHLTSNVLKVKPDSPAAKAGVPEAASIKSITITTENEQYKALQKSLQEDASITIPFTTAKKDVTLKNMAAAQWILQQIPSPTVTLEFVGDKPQPIKLKPVESDEYYLPKRGLILEPIKAIMKADSWSNAVSMGVAYTRRKATVIYATLRSLFTGDLSVKNLHGPLGIAQAAVGVSEQGMTKLLRFLGFLSVNLAVLNFLPIPVLDGGHMVFLIWEGVTRRKPSRKVLEFATLCGIVFVVGLMIFVIGLDVLVHTFKLF